MSNREQVINDLQTQIEELEERLTIALEGQPEIVRCKDCKYLIDHYGFMDDRYCKNMREMYYLKFKPEADWFCADGERK